MRYMRCKCGERTCWTSMGHPDCDGCDECNTTLAEAPDGHTEPIPHDWRERFVVNEATGERGKERECSRCFKREKVIPAEYTIYIDNRAVVVPARQSTARDVKIAGRIDPTFSLYLLGDGEPGATLLADDAEVGVSEGSRFVSIPPAHF